MVNLNFSTVSGEHLDIQPTPFIQLVPNTFFVHVYRYHNISSQYYYYIRISLFLMSPKEEKKKKNQPCAYGHATIPLLNISFNMKIVSLN